MSKTGSAYFAPASSIVEIKLNKEEKEQFNRTVEHVKSLVEKIVI